MIRYRYAAQFTPPAPFVHVNLVCPATGNRVENLAAQIDTAADRTVLPGRVVEDLGLVEDGRLLFQGFTGAVVELPVFLVAVQIHDLPPVLTRAVLGASESHILLGRDVLNAHHLLLDGPSLALEIDRHASAGAAK
jgi:predicted aspartyl protease